MRFSALFTMSLLSLSPAAAITLPQAPVLPRYEIVEALGTTDFFASLAIDPITQRPVVAYVDTSGLDESSVGQAPVKLRSDDGWTWRSDTLGLLAMTGSAGEALRTLRLVADAQGRRHVLVIEPKTNAANDDAVVYFRRDANGDTREILDSGNVRQATLTVAPDGRVYVAWIRDTGVSGGTLMARMRGNDGSWIELQPGASAGVSFLPAFALTPIEPVSGLVHLVWAETQGNLQQVSHATFDGAFPSVRVVANFAPPGLIQNLFVASASDGTLEAGIVRAVTSVEHVIQRRVLAPAATVWNCAASGCAYALPTLAAQYANRALALGPAGRRALTYNNIEFITGLAFEDPPRAQPWHVEQVAPIARLQDVAYDREGNLYAVGVDTGNHRDLMLMRLRAPWSDVEIAGPGSGLASIPSSVALSRDRDGAPVVFARSGPQDENGAAYTFENGAFVAHPLPIEHRVVAADIAVANDGTLHVAFRDGNNEQVMHAQRSPLAGSAWVVTRVSMGPVPAFDPRIVIGPDDAPRVLYRQADVLAVAGQLDTGVWLTHEIGSPATGASRPRLAGTREAHLLYASWFDAAANQLRVTSVYGDVAEPGADVSITDRSPTFPAGWVAGSTAHDIAIADSGGIAIAYSQIADELTGIGYSRFGGSSGWQGIGSEPAPFSSVPISRIVLDTAFTMSSAPRIAWIQGATTATQRLVYAEKRFSGFTWEVTDLGLYDATTPTLALTTRGGVRVAYADGSALIVARRQESLDLGTIGGTFPLISRHASLVALCGESYLQFFGTGLPGRPARGSSAILTADDADVIERVRERFATTPAGRYYLQLFEEHRGEIFDLTISNPQRFIERMRTLSDLMPGLVAFANGDGSALRLRTPILQSARAVWQDWALWGSPELRVAVNAELARTNNLGTFTNMNFEQWFGSLTVGTATDVIHRAGFEP